MIVYVNNETELRNLRVGQEGYYQGYFFEVRRLHKVTSNSAGCPCSVYPCAFNSHRPKADDGGFVCPHFNACSANHRSDKASVVFARMTPSEERFNDFKAWCKKNEKPFKPVLCEES